MYIPLGGRDTRMVNIWLIFLFVSIWHDIEAKLVIWGLLNASFYILEILGGMLIKSDTILNNLSTSFIKLLGLFSAATYIIILIFVNLIGYSMLGSKKILCWDGLKTITIVYYFLFIGVWVMNFYKTYKNNKNNKNNIK